MQRFLPILLLLFSAACVTQLVEPGTLQGHVNIGPLSPVERAGAPPPTVPPEVYAARQIVIYSSDGNKVVTRISPDAEGNYRVTLAPGSYTVDMARVGIDRAKGLPTTVTVESGKTITLDISIDTGIR